MRRKFKDFIPIKRTVVIVNLNVIAFMLWLTLLLISETFS